LIALQLNLHHRSLWPIPDDTNLVFNSRNGKKEMKGGAIPDKTSECDFLIADIKNVIT